MKIIVALAVFILALASVAGAAMTQGMPDNAKQQLALGNMKLKTDTLKARLYVTSATTMSIAATTACSATGELSGGNYAPVTLTGADVTLDTTNHYAIFSFASPSWNNLTAAHVDGMAICDYSAPSDTVNGTLVAYYTFTDTPVSAGTLTLNVPAAAYNTGILTWH